MTRLSVVRQIIAMGLATLTAVGFVGSAVPLGATAVALGQSCAIEHEPNDTPEATESFAGPVCVEGHLPDSDQDLVLWQVGAADAATRWTFSVDGSPDVLTALKIFKITSEPGQEPIVVDRTHLMEVAVQPGTRSPAVQAGVMLPVGAYVLGISRSARTSTGEPALPYTYRIERDTPVPSGLDVEPNDDIASAARVAGEFETGGDLDGSLDWYAWDVPATDERWGIELQVPLGQPAALELVDPAGTTIDQVRGTTTTRSLDLELAPGVYGISVSPRAYEAAPYVLSAVRMAADGDREPNDDSATAMPIPDGVATKGRLAGPDDRDRFALRVPVADRALRDLRVIWRSDLERQLCLLGPEDAEISCRRGTGGVALQNLALAPGRHVFELRGAEDPEDPYVMRVDVTSTAAADFEAEPNDLLESATVLDPTLDMRARGSQTDVDIYRVRTTGDPQLWQVDLVGDPAGRLELMQGNGRSLERVQVDAKEGLARLTDLYLIPGDHWFRVQGAEGEYALEMTSLGPPDPSREREPNGESVRAERYRIGTRRTGRLATSSDVDTFRFSLAAAQHVALRVDQPADAQMRLILRYDSRSDSEIGRIQSLPAGAAIAYDLWLQPGDYLIELRPEQASEGIYELTSERLDPFDLAVDQEPNDGPAWARPLPPSLEWPGSATDSGDEDWFLVPALTSTDDLRIRVDDERAHVRLQTADGQAVLTREDDGAYLASGWSNAPPIHVVVSADGPYRASLSGGGLVPIDTAEGALPVDLSLSVDDSVVAAYWPAPQQVRGALEVTNRGPKDLDLTLDAATSHYLWTTHLEMADLNLPAGGTLSVPVRVDVGADAWADEPVSLSLRARSASSADSTTGAHASASIELSAEAGAPPVSARAGWTVPPSLLGGIDVAAIDLGAVPGRTVAGDSEDQLYDRVTPDGGGFGTTFTELPLELTVDLAGEAAVPIAGIILNPQARAGRLSEVPRDFELLLSVDGLTWHSALVGQLAPLPIDQAFPLPEPIEATQAMLRIGTLYDSQPRSVALGEWKVIAVPGTALPGGPVDVAAGAVGGHVVRLRPDGPNRDAGPAMLDGSAEREAIHLRDDRVFDVVIGFHEGRAALVSSLQWLDPTGSEPTERLDEVDLEFSLGSPLGPWQAIGSWRLERAADGTVSPFVLEQPSWARFVRLRGSASADARALELPAALRVLESGDDDYRSIIGEWGYTSPRGPLEWMRGDAATEAPSVEDAGDDPGAATLLEPNSLRLDRVEIDVDEDWYAIEVPAADNTLELVVEGQPTVRTSLQLFDAAGAQRPLAFRQRPDGSVLYQAAVEPGARYGLRVFQPPFSAVFTFDTSSSIGPFLDIVTEGMRSFAADVKPGREAVMIVPFEEAPLLPTWEDETYVLQDAVDQHDFQGGSSGAEAGLISASELLAEREGARAILLVTDAETSTAQRSGELWERLEAVRPIIFSVHVGAASRPVESRHLMQDWAAAGVGYYAYPTTSGEMDRAFDRMATWLRRPADYSLSYATLALGPSSLRVATPAGETAAVSGLAPGVGVEIILDTSGSMLKKLSGSRRIDIAKDALKSLVGEALAEDLPVALRTFGGKGKKAKARCQTRLTRPLQPLERRSMLELIGKLGATKKTKTPISAALAAVATDLSEISGPRSVILVTDGAETCGGDPAAAIEGLQAAGIDVTINIVGFALDDEGLKAQMAEWAEAGNGTYFDAAGADELATSLATAVRAPYRVYGPDGEAFEGGTVDGDAIHIDPGTYRVEVLTDPPLTFDEVVVEAGETVTLELPATE